MSTTDKTDRSRSRRIRVLVIALAIVALVYVVLLPWRKRMNEETARIRAEGDRALHPAPSTTKQEVDKAVADAAARPADATAQMRAAAFLADSGSLAAAWRHASAAVKLQPGSSAAWLLIADIQQRLRDYYDAMQSYRTILAHGPDRRAFAGLGFLYIQFGWTLDAVDLMQEATRRFPDDPRLHDVLALAFVQQNEMRKAEKELLLARKLAPGDPSLWSQLADVYNKSHRPAEAIAIARDALRIVPNDTPVQDELGLGYLDNGDLKEAIATFQRIVAQDPQDFDAHYNLGVALNRAGRTADAQAEFETVMRASPHIQQVQLLLGQLYLREGRTADGSRLLAAFKAEQAKRARAQQLGYALSTRRNEAPIHRQMALSYVDDGEMMRAITELRKALELNPKYTPARQDLNRILSSHPKRQ